MAGLVVRPVDRHANSVPTVESCGAVADLARIMHIDCHAIMAQTVPMSYTCKYPYSDRKYSHYLFIGMFYALGIVYALASSVPIMVDKVPVSFLHHSRAFCRIA